MYVRLSLLNGRLCGCIMPHETAALRHGALVGGTGRGNADGRLRCNPYPEMPALRPAPERSRIIGLTEKGCRDHAAMLLRGEAEKRGATITSEVRYIEPRPEDYQRYDVTCNPGQRTVIACAECVVAGTDTI
jgi:hypothetical protein